MREYNLFVIKKEYYKLYKKREHLLFDILVSIKKMNNEHGLFLYNQLCNIINVGLLNNYLNNKFNLNKNGFFYLNDVIFIIKHSRIIIKTKYNFPKIIKFLNYYNSYFFVVDYQNNDYFWLNDFAKEKVLL